MELFLKLFALLFIDVILSVDNAILIASQTRSLEGSKRKIAETIGGIGAIIFRLIFVIIVMFTLNALSQIPAIYILGGILLIYLGLSLTNEKKINSKNQKNKD